MQQQGEQGANPQGCLGQQRVAKSSFVPVVLRFNSICLGSDGMGLGGSAKSCFCFGIAACTGSRLGFVLAHSPLWRWPGA